MLFVVSKKESADKSDITGPQTSSDIAKLVHKPAFEYFPLATKYHLSIICERQHHRRISAKRHDFNYIMCFAKVWLMCNLTLLREGSLAAQL